MIYAVVNTKGGVGKTTIAVHLATKLASEGKTLLIDGDPQQSAASWAVWRRDNPDLGPGPTTVCLVGKAILSEGQQLAEGFDNVVVDAGGRDSVGLRSSLLLAQCAIVPLGASNFDAAAMTDLLTIVDLAKDFNPTLKVQVLLSRIDQRTKDTPEMIEFLEKENLDRFQTKICERVAFRRAVGEGSTVSEYKKDRAAIAEIESFYKEVIAI
ncbi:MAG: AAA family ATPase [Desulfomonilaceae bacterium]